MTCTVVFAVILTGVAAAQPGFPSSYSGEPQKTGIASTQTPPQLVDITFKQRLNEQLPLDAMFKDEEGHDVALGRFFGSRPVILAFVYYTCPMLCTQVMNGISSALKVVPFTAGKDFDVVLISFDPRDTPKAAAEKKASHLDHWSSQSDANAWHLLTGNEASIKRVTSAAGFSYRWDEVSQQYAHVSGILTVTPEGRLSRYFYGVEYSPKDIRLALVESGQGKIGSAVDELFLYCFHYDPTTARYGVIVMNLIRIGGVLTMLFIGGFILVMRRRDTHPMTHGQA
jgi:protein SCO1/2